MRPGDSGRSPLRDGSTIDRASPPAVEFGPARHARGHRLRANAGELCVASKRSPSGTKSVSKRADGRRLRPPLFFTRRRSAARPSCPTLQPIPEPLKRFRRMPSTTYIRAKPSPLTGFVTVQVILQRARRVPIGDCCVTTRKGMTRAPRGLSLALSLLVLGVTSGDIGHALAGGAWHGPGTTIAPADGGPAAPNSADPLSSHVATDCPACRAGRASSAALSARVACFSSTGETSCADFLPESSGPASPPRRANAARAPPARPSA